MHPLRAWWDESANTNSEAHIRELSQAIHSM